MYIVQFLTYKWTPYTKIVPTNDVVMKPMDLLGCHIELLTQLVDLLAKDHVETYMYNSYRPYGHINKTNGPT